MRLAIVSPWPSDRSGIADYVFTLVQGLKRYPLEITIYTLSSTPTPMDGVRFVTGPATNWQLTDHDLIVYQFGNNATFHSHMLELIQQFPGVVQLHDFVLQHLFCSVASINQDWSIYLDPLEQFYGEEISNEARMNLSTAEPFWGRSDILRYPLCEAVLQYSQGAIVHSQFVLDKIHEVFPLLPVVSLPQAYPLETQNIEDRNDSEFRIGIFGHLSPNRCVETLLRALKSMDTRQRSIVIRAVGPCIDSQYKSKLLELIEPMKDRVQFDAIGYVDQETFLNEIASCDLCCSLRNPTLGETSAIVVRAMMFGRPTVVTKTGWYAELPDCVLKIDAENGGEEELGNLLDRLIHHKDYYRNLSQATLAHAHNFFHFEQTIDRFFHSLHGLYQAWNSTKERDTSLGFTIEGLATAMNDLKLNTKADEAGIRQGIYRKLAFCYASEPLPHLR